jgi:hypothetical protein
LFVPIQILVPSFEFFSNPSLEYISEAKIREEDSSASAAKNRKHHIFFQIKNHQNQKNYIIINQKKIKIIHHLYSIIIICIYQFRTKKIQRTQNHNHRFFQNSDQNLEPRNSQNNTPSTTNPEFTNHHHHQRKLKSETLESVTIKRNTNQKRNTKKEEEGIRN